MGTTLNGDAIMLQLVKDMTDTREEGKYSFYKSATEAIISKGDVNAKTAVLTRLYKDISNKSMVDFGEIPNSKGDFTKYKHYDLCVSVMDSLNEIYKDGKKFEEVQLMNDIYDLLITLRDDFKFGFLHNIEFIKLQYNTLVLTFHELENICIMAYLKYVRDVKAATISFDDYRKKDLMVLKSAKDFLASYNRGEWKQMMKSFKRGNGGATEAFSMSGSVKFDTPNFMFGGKTPGETGSDARSDGFLKLFMQMIQAGDDKIKNKALKGLYRGGLAVVGVLTILSILRGLVFYFYNKSARISDYLKLQTSFIEVAENDPQARNPKTAKLCKGMVNLANKVVGIIDGKIFNANAKATKDLKNANAGLADDVETAMNTPELDDGTPGDSEEDFTLM